MIFVTALIITVILIISCIKIKKPTVRVILGMAAFFNILIMILAGSFTYTIRYKIHDVASYIHMPGWFLKMKQEQLQNILLI